MNRALILSSIGAAEGTATLRQRIQGNFQFGQADHADHSVRAIQEVLSAGLNSPCCDYNSK